MALLIPTDYTEMLWEGLPLRLPKGCAVPMIRPTDPEDRKPVLCQQMVAQVYDLGKPDDLKEYNAAYQLMTIGHALQSKEEGPTWSSQTSSYHVFLRYVLLFFVLPPRLLEAVGYVAPTAEVV